MKRLMEKKFLPVTHKQDSYLEFHNLKQQTLTVEEFISEFERVRMRCGVEENEEQTIARFLGGLRTDISDVVYLQQYYSFHDVCRLALKVEKQLLAKQKTTTRFGSSSRAPQSATGPVRVGPIKDACHILLGRPWLYDRRVKHDGYRNTYTFKKDGVNITLAPLNPKDGVNITDSYTSG
ncbi:reverse transcriptase domain-containing protein [Tanacetum coccineum]